MNKPKYKIGDKIWLSVRRAHHFGEFVDFLYCGPAKVEDIWTSTVHGIIIKEYDLKFPFPLVGPNNTNYVVGQVLYFRCSDIDNNSELING